MRICQVRRSRFRSFYKQVISARLVRDNWLPQTQARIDQRSKTTFDPVRMGIKILCRMKYLTEVGGDCIGTKYAGRHGCLIFLIDILHALREMRAVEVVRSVILIRTKDI